MSEWATFDQLLLEAKQCLEAIRDALVAGPTETPVHGIVQYLEGVIEAISRVETSLPDTELSPLLDALTELTVHPHLYIQTDNEVLLQQRLLAILLGCTFLPSICPS